MEWATIEGIESQCGSMQTPFAIEFRFGKTWKTKRKRINIILHLFERKTKEKKILLLKTNLQTSPNLCCDLQQNTTTRSSQLFFDKEKICGNRFGESKGRMFLILRETISLQCDDKYWKRILRIFFLRFFGWQNTE